MVTDAVLASALASATRRWLRHAPPPGQSNQAGITEPMTNQRTPVPFRVRGAWVVALIVLAGCGVKEPETKGGPLVSRRLSEEQYRTSIADIFGPDIKIGGRFEPEIRANGLLAVGQSKVTISPTALEQFEKMALSIADQVVSESRRKSLACSPSDARAPDDACAARIIQSYGTRLYRRPLADGELAQKTALAKSVTASSSDFYIGLKYALGSLLVSPRFLFRHEVAEAKDGAFQLDGYSKASRISFFLWNAPPDQELLDAAQNGELDTARGRDRQVERLIASPRFEHGVRTFFSDFMAFDDFDLLAKDAVIYPKFSPRVTADAREQTMRTIINQVLTQQGDYRDIFTTRKTEMTRNLGMVYRIPVAEDGWQPYEFPEGDPRAGVLSQISFLALHSHPGRSSPTLRGKAVRELVLCQAVPPPPPDVNFDAFQDISDPNYKTARQRLKPHETQKACAACHKITDPIGLAFENFDSLGQHRTHENGALIDPSGVLDEKPFRDARSLAEVMRNHPAVPSCLVQSLYKYGSGRVVGRGERPWMTWLEEEFASSGYKIPQIMRSIVLSEGFYAVTATNQQMVAEVSK